MVRIIGRKPVCSRATNLDIARIAFIGGIFLGRHVFNRRPAMEGAG
jgi:hypothetical protein